MVSWNRAKFSALCCWLPVHQSQGNSTFGVNGPGLCCSFPSPNTAATSPVLEESGPPAQVQVQIPQVLPLCSGDLLSTGRAGGNVATPAAALGLASAPVKDNVVLVLRNRRRILLNNDFSVYDGGVILSRHGQLTLIPAKSIDLPATYRANHSPIGSR